ncbi:LysR family transcriptional regulator [Streptomyces sp. NPDC020490]|uniref:LysR family transcriptional regulator n=1 Tax=Streptomyces sp. NPDC020490 TaxID=3365078 RepID=UPI0037AC9BB8
MEARQLRYVLAIAQHRNIRAAARALHIAMQSLSQQLNAVERELGVKLFERSPAGVSLTKAGEVFVARAAVAVQAVDDVTTATRAAVQADGEPVRLGVATGLAGLAADVLRHFLTARPDADVRVADLGTASQVDALTDRRITAGIGYTPPDRKTVRGLAVHRLRVAPVRALLAADDPLARKRTVSLSELARRPLLLPSAPDAAGLRAHLLALFDAHGLQPRLGPGVHGHEMAMASVAAGRGYTLCVPEQPLSDDDVTFAAIAEEVPPLEMCLLTRRDDRGEAVGTLVGIARTMTRPRTTPVRPRRPA